MVGAHNGKPACSAPRTASTPARFRMYRQSWDANDLLSRYRSLTLHDVHRRPGGQQSQYSLETSVPLPVDAEPMGSPLADRAGIGNARRDTAQPARDDRGRNGPLGYKSAAGYSRASARVRRHEGVPGYGGVNYIFLYVSL